MAKGEGTAPKGIDLRVRFTGSTLAKSAGPRLNTNDFAGRALAQLDAHTRAALAKAEPHVMAWLRADRANVAKYAMDPIGSLIAAGVDRELVGKLAALRAASSRVPVDLPGVTIDRFEVEVEPAKRGG